MLENIIKKTLTTLTLAGALFSQGCAHFKAVDPYAIQPVEMIYESLKKEYKQPIDFSKLNYQEAIEVVRTPYEAQKYLLEHFIWDNKAGKGESFKVNHIKRRGVCLDYASAAAALLSDNGYPPLILLMYSKEHGHAVFLYRTEKGFGILGKPSSPPRYKSVKELMEKGINKMYQKKFTHYFVADLDESLKDRSWIYSNDIDLQDLRLKFGDDNHIKTVSKESLK